MTAKIDLSQFKGFSPAPLEYGCDGYIRKADGRETVAFLGGRHSECEGYGKLFAAAPAILAYARELEAENDRLTKLAMAAEARDDR